MNEDLDENLQSVQNTSNKLKNKRKQNWKNLLQSQENNEKN